ncbi:MAG TPA: sulfite exporter TauE/SafE family protein [Burkholderiales bacterium]|nr:sulfite exporter TauE/SafE family protein [Burkholderiales bacterium]
MFDPATLVLIALTFLLGGAVKGVIGLGLPTVSLALLTATIGLQPAMALLLVPSFATNVWQAVAGGYTRALTVRLWPFLLLATASVSLGAMALTRVNIALLSALLGSLLVLYSIVNLVHPHLAIPRSWEPWTGPLAGAANGILTGMTGSFVVPGVIFLHAIGLPRDVLVQAMGMLFTVSTVGLALALGGQHLLSFELGAVSGAALLPAAVGMLAGQNIRKRLSEARFRRVFFVSLLVLGSYIVVRSLAKYV